MRLPDIRKILREDIKSTEKWVSDIIDPINSFMDTIYLALNKNVTPQENIRCILHEVSVSTSAAYPTQDPIKFPNTMKIKATGLWVTACFDRRTYEPATGPVYAAWIEDNGVINVNGLTGLEASKTYTVRFMVI